MLDELEISVTIAQGRDLVAKDRALLSRQRTTSDPYVQVCLLVRSGNSSGNNRVLAVLGKTAVIAKNCANPVWNATLARTWRDREVQELLSSSSTKMSNSTAEQQLFLQCRIFDADAVSQDDPMGIVEIPLSSSSSSSSSLTALQWYPVRPGNPSTPAYYCANATGELQVSVRVQAKSVRDIARGNQMILSSASSSLSNTASNINANRILQIGLAWHTRQPVDLDSSVVALDHHGNVDLTESVYYGNLHNANQSIIHSGDDTTGDGAVQDDDEVITLKLQQIPSRIIALYFVLTVATPGQTLTHVTSAVVQFRDITASSTSNRPKVICRYAPAQESFTSSEDTALVLVRLSRNNTNGNTNEWTLTPIQEGFGYARDFGSLIPELKGYTRDLIPDKTFKIDPTERIAMLRKGGAVRVLDYCHGNGHGNNNHKQLPTWLTLGLAWDVTNGVNIDLDASAVLVDDNFGLVDTVWFRKLQSEDRAVLHSGDEREGDEAGDDEKIKVNLNVISDNVHYICFVLNSFSGQELDDVSKASCHLFDPETRTEVAKYTMTNASELNRHTALLVACLYRPKEEEGNQNASRDWRLWILAQPRQGRTVQDNVFDVLDYLRTHSPPPITPPYVPTAENEEEIVVTAMPTDTETIREEDEIAVMPMEDIFVQK